MDEDRSAIVAGGRRLGARGLVVAAEGNLSIRLADGRLLVTPSGRRKDELAPGDLVLVPANPPADSDPIDANGLRPTSDIAIHRAIRAARPDARAIVHAHLPAAIALTLAGEIPDPAILPETALFIPRLPFVAYGALGSDELAARIADALTKPPDPPPNVALLERHGAIAVGETIAEAVDRLELVDLLCRVWRDARLLGAVRGAGRSRPPGS